MFKSIWAVLTAGVIACVTIPAGAAVLSDDRDSEWSATGTSVDFEVLRTGGALNASGDIDIGLYSIASPATRITLFSSGIATGETASVSSADVSSILGGVFGFFISNVGTTLDGPYTYFSESASNPSIGGRDAGLDAMLFDRIGGGMYEVEIEDWFLPISSFGDFQIKASGLSPTAVPLPASIVLLFMGVGGLAAMGRKSRS